jgi:hypothetical protein
MVKALTHACNEAPPPGPVSERKTLLRVNAATVLNRLIRFTFDYPKKSGSHFAARAQARGKRKLDNAIETKTIVRMANK